MQLFYFLKPDITTIPLEPTPPQNYTALKDLVLGSMACVQTMVVSCKDMKKTAKGDCCLTFYVKDFSKHPSKVTVTIFRKNNEEIPELSSGDLIILDQIKVQEFNGQPQLLILYQSRISIYKPSSDNLHANHQIDYKALPEYLSYLYLWGCHGIEISSQTGKLAIQNHCDDPIPCSLNINDEKMADIGLCLFSELKPGRGLFSIAIEIVYIFQQKNPNCFEIIATDYTSNCSSSPIENQEIIPEYFIGRNMLFRVTFWDEHSRKLALKQASPGTMLLLKDCVAKSSKYFKLEVVLHGSRTEQKNKIMVLSEHYIDNLLKRKLEFLKSIEESKNVISERTKVLTNILHPNAPKSELDDIIKNPKVTYIYRLQSQVIGFYPDPQKDGMASFCKPFCPSCLSLEISLSEAICYSCKSSKIVPTWKYIFFLKLKIPGESYNSHLPVLVFNQQARKFLRNLPAANLENDLNTRIQLKNLLNAIMDQTIELCIVSYKISPDNNVCFQLFDTEMTESCNYKE